MDYFHVVKKYFGEITATIALKHVDFPVKCLEILSLCSNLQFTWMRMSLLFPPKSPLNQFKIISNILLIFRTDWVKIVS